MPRRQPSGAGGSGSESAPSTPRGPLPPGTPAPDFSLPATTDAALSLSAFRGQPVILVFYPADRSSVCSSQLALYNQALPMFTEQNAHLLAISVDDMESHQDFAGQLRLTFPLLSDSDPKGYVAQAYGVYDSHSGNSQRALFVVNQAGIIHWSYVAPRSENPGADGILAALDSLVS